jgi:hypothetical protein
MPIRPDAIITENPSSLFRVDQVNERNDLGHSADRTVYATVCRRGNAGGDLKIGRAVSHVTTATAVFVGWEIECNRLHRFPAVVLPKTRLCFDLGADFIPATGAFEREAGQRSTTIHGALERLQSVDLTLCLPIVPRFEDGIANRLDILPQCPDRTSHDVDATCAGIVEPDVQPLHRSAAK